MRKRLCKIAYRLRLYKLAHCISPSVYCMEVGREAMRYVEGILAKQQEVVSRVVDAMNDAEVFNIDG